MHRLNAQTRQLGHRLGEVEGGGGEGVEGEVKDEECEWAKS